MMEEIKEFWRKYHPYFLDFWQYLLIIVVFAVLALIYL